MIEMLSRSGSWLAGALTMSGRSALILTVQSLDKLIARNHSSIRDSVVGPVGFRRPVRHLVPLNNVVFCSRRRTGWF
jgi:hypothetical protein